MSITLVLVVVMAVLYAAGVYQMLERSLTRILIGFLLVGNATNILILLMAGRSGVAPFVTDDGRSYEQIAEEMADPLPQALILTAIVITFGVSAFLLAMIYRRWRLANADQVEDDETDASVRADAAGISAQTTADDRALDVLLESSDEGTAAKHAESAMTDDRKEDR
ncbi:MULTISPECIES: Na(+)/H(+) antiporter subunit C [unclassified Rathayibacter]|uniref:Na(+)/H(+) antiporter subunit C n=1 Tax=unclassified Rathayibacter TaxID=2609250 RepID=UPI000F4CE61C|nr:MULTISPECIES: Na(+)/H(+) antiporter subunit C [unclassified Rathayibacter]MCJ1702937.1 Na(+)/H(+) antiporter subunit C [Rathayibacter sp. VKM Ac-2926]ROP45070.1 multicomponent Na+:H+ antiporter subunit C [Rathayibacter sp. PhB186]ROS47893.1 multicomponent Na+:H+ antiporter subunit C [Rathayibacter sp. PhB185]TCL81781.1 multicomponent Na+:H+ antiporter subunit C [Rathayibacter sp. PhB192]TCM26790.1 multicomponent Na+:H+ antiporter subunit C [Rathayibacter sp. PhB179]